MTGWAGGAARPCSCTARRPAQTSLASRATPLTITIGRQGRKLDSETRQRRRRKERGGRRRRTRRTGRRRRTRRKFPRQRCLRLLECSGRALQLARGAAPAGVNERRNIYHGSRGGQGGTANWSAASSSFSS